MIHGTIETWQTTCGGLLHVGRCVVTNETVSAGQVMALQLPDGPARGFERVTLFWRNRQRDGWSECAFEIHDRRLTTSEDRP